MAQNLHNKKPSSHPKPLEVNMTKKDLKKKLAYLESLNDHLLSELGYIDRLMRLVGFAGGLQTIKLTAQELYATEKDDELGE
jgi:hypothetical protein